MVEDAPARPTGTRAAAELPSGGDTRTFHTRAVMIVELLKVADPTSNWKQRLITLLNTYRPHINEAAMGFTPGVENPSFLDLTPPTAARRSAYKRKNVIKRAALPAMLTRIA